VSGAGKAYAVFIQGGARATPPHSYVYCCKRGTVEEAQGAVDFLHPGAKAVIVEVSEEADVRSVRAMRTEIHRLREEVLRFNRRSST